MLVRNSLIIVWGGVSSRDNSDSMLLFSTFCFKGIQKATVKPGTFVKTDKICFSKNR